ncbi:NAD(P)/FAD-dependent oxidoreductase [Sphingomonas sp. RB56-2]|uniref:NADH:ubiquinone reductase (non-electrogenic) n=1 Tax=Sphingomonas brevis TaxID=2908206 RepID=A0ABT0SAK6_9SPHN|nr:NAD(P)/FAD-dependent oxidoreductase [Sphingomonas brevis]MCL6741445.1 NAD(P)/FAD-dependent oxidoreductase [Sphingomonas brevis]
MSERAPRVVIVGAGFGGLAAAKRLVGKRVDVTLVDRRNHHLFQPLLYQVATAALSPADIAAPIRSILSSAPNVRVLLDEVVGIESSSNQVILDRTGPLAFDWLILSTGACHSYFGQDHWASHAPGLKSIEDAVDIRRRVLLALELAETETDATRRRRLLTFVVIGGGPTGVEMAGAIAELARRSASNDFRSITPRCSRVVLVEAGSRVLPAFPPPLSLKAEQALSELGVEVLVNSPVSNVAGDHVASGRVQIPAHTVVWAAGVQASPAAQWLKAEHDRQGRIFVERDLRVPDHDRIFAIGDTANVPSMDGQALPAIAPVAKQQGRWVADQILGRCAMPFAYRSFGNLATIGRSKAVIEWGNYQQSGFIAWLIWSLAHIWFLVGFRSRLAVGISWLWNYFTYQRSARLITDEAVSSSRILGREAGA